MQFEEAARAIDSVGRLALLHRSGGAGFGKDLGAAARSFWAYALVSPAIALTIAVVVIQSGSKTPAIMTAAETIATAIELTAFPLLLIPVLRFYGRPERWAWFITGYNWFNAAKYAVQLAVLGLNIGLGPWPLRATVVYLFVIEAFLAEAILDVGGAKAAGIVLLDAFFSLLVEGIASEIGAGSFF